MVELRKSVIRSIATAAVDVTMYTVTALRNFKPETIYVNNRSGAILTVDLYDGPSATGIWKYRTTIPIGGWDRIPTNELGGLQFETSLVVLNDVQPIDVFVGGFEEA